MEQQHRNHWIPRMSSEELGSALAFLLAVAIIVGLFAWYFISQAQSRREWEEYVETKAATQDAEVRANGGWGQRMDELRATMEADGVQFNTD